MNAVEKIQAAVQKLEDARDEVIATEKVSVETAMLAIRMIPAALKILRTDAKLIEASTPEQLERVLSAAERAGDLALAVAILGDAS